MSAPMGLVLIGPPGVGKGTQAAHLREEFQLAHIATGDLLREHRARDTKLGRQASEYMTSGRLVPDDLVVAMVQERIDASPRFLLDGFPRTLPQAVALADALELSGRELTAAVFIDAPDAAVVERIAGRADGRDDDDLDTVRRRLKLFHISTAPVIDYYGRLGRLYRIDASRPTPEVYEDARALLSRLSANPGREVGHQRGGHDPHARTAERPPGPRYSAAGGFRAWSAASMPVAHPQSSSNRRCNCS